MTAVAEPDLTPGRIAVLYPAAWIGDAVADVAARHDFDVIRTDGHALYSRGSRLMRWLEDCAVWCCGGWRTAAPRFSRIVGDGIRIFSEAVCSDDDRVEFQRRMVEVFWHLRDESLRLHEWLVQMRDGVLEELAESCTTLDEEWGIMTNFLKRTGEDDDLTGMTLGQFAGFGDGGDRLNLSTLHSAKGREFDVVVLFGMDDGRIPRSRSSKAIVLEARRLFYVGFTRAKREVHIVYTEHDVSPLVTELWDRLQEH